MERAEEALVYYVGLLDGPFTSDEGFDTAINRIKLLQKLIKELSA